MRTILTFAFVLSCVTIADAQGRYSYDQHYLGFHASFGRHFFSSQSNYSQINRSVIAADGAQVGVTFGTSLVRADLGLMGYYTSVSNIAGTVDLYTNHAAIRFYPIHLFTKRSIRLEPYLNGGFTYDRYKFYGHYASNNSGPINYSAPEPLLGAIKQVNTSLGIGFEYKILDAYDFVHLFTEAKWGGPVKQEISGSEFGHTQLGRKMMVSVGVGFGRYR